MGKLRMLSLFAGIGGLDLGNAVAPAQCYPLFATLVYVDALLRQELEATA